MNEFEILSQYAVPRFSVSPDGDIQTENLMAITPQEEKFDLDVPF